MIKTAEKFWKTRKEYPPVTCNFQRRYLDLGIVLNYTDGVDSLLDLGCGEGQMLLMLRELTNIKNYYGYDLSKTFIDNLIKRWGDKPIETQVVNFTAINKLPKTDMCICMGVMLYISDDVILKGVLKRIRSKILIVRVPCSLGKNRLEIDKYSEDYKCEYAAVYRTIPEYISILSEFFNIKVIDRCYPDKIESSYGSKQFYFMCERREGNEKN